MDSNDPSAHTPATSRKPSTVRMVIRARIEPDPIPEVPREEWNFKAIVLAVILLLALLTGAWFGVRAFYASRTAIEPMPVPVPANDASPPSAEPMDAAPPLTEAPPPPGAGDTATTSPSVVPTIAITKVQPDVSQRALDTIRGTVRVAIEVTIDGDGNVIATNTTNPGPSRYFERASRTAAEKWQFNTSDSVEPRTILLRFHYTRRGVETFAEEPSDSQQ